MPRARVVVEDRVQIKAACSVALYCAQSPPILSHDDCAILLPDLLLLRRSPAAADHAATTEAL